MGTANSTEIGSQAVQQNDHNDVKELQEKEYDSEDELDTTELTLSEQVMEMMQLSLAIYGLADLRSLAKEGKLPDPVADDIMVLPMTADHIASIFSDHYETIHQHHEDSNFLDLYLGAAPDLQRLVPTSETKPLLHDKSGPKKSAFGTAKILVFDDEHSETELVYALGVNK